MSTTEQFEPLTDGQLSGVFIVLTIATFSVVALTVLGGYTTFAAVRSVRNRSRTPARSFVFFKTQLGLYVASLLASNGLNAIAGLVLAYWAAKKGVEEDSECTAQGVLMQIGHFATAYFTVAIAVHTFMTLVLRTSHQMWVSMSLAGFGWLVSALTGIIPAFVHGHSGPIFGNDGFACGIRRIYPVPQFVFHLLPIFAASALSAVLFSLTFLVLRGTLSFSRGVKLQLNPNQRWSGRVGTYEEYHRFIGAIARSMLWYPFAYVVLLLPYSVTRLLDISGFVVGFNANVFAYSCTFLLGLVNVILLYNTFRVLGPAFSGLPTARPQTEVESFGTIEKPPPMDTVASPARAFPPPRRDHDAVGAMRYPSGGASALTHSPSNSAGDGSLRLLIPANPNPIAPPNRGHFANGSVDSGSSRSTTPSPLGRAITPVSELNAHFPPEPVRQPSPSGLAPPPRTVRSPSPRQSSLNGSPGPRPYGHVRGASSLSQSSPRPQQRPLPGPPLRQQPSLTAVVPAPPALVPQRRVPPPSPSDFGGSVASSASGSLRFAQPTTTYASANRPGYGQGRHPIRYYR